MMNRIPWMQGGGGGGVNESTIVDSASLLTSNLSLFNIPFKIPVFTNK